MPLRLAELFVRPACRRGLPGRQRRQGGGRRAAGPSDIKAYGFVGSSDIAQYIYAHAAANGKRAQCFGGARTT